MVAREVASATALRDASISLQSVLKKGSKTNCMKSLGSDISRDNILPWQEAKIEKSFVGVG